MVLSFILIINYILGSLIFKLSFCFTKEHDKEILTKKIKMNLEIEFSCEKGYFNWKQYDNLLNLCPFSYIKN